MGRSLRGADSKAGAEPQPAARGSLPGVPGPAFGYSVILTQITAPRHAEGAGLAF